jgi:transcriptional regulator with XRE-family HTH domain
MSSVHHQDFDDLDQMLESFGQDPEFAGAYSDAQMRSRLLQSLISRRKDQGLSQTDVAKYMGTTQSAVSLLEGGTTDSQLSTLQRYAQAIGTHLEIQLPQRRTSIEVEYAQRSWRSGQIEHPLPARSGQRNWNVIVDCAFVKS